MSDEKRRELLERLDALMNMTVENGCSEHEAEVAAAKAARLMDQYGLSLEELRSLEPEQAIKTEETWTDNKKKHPTIDCSYWVAQLTSTRILFSPNLQHLWYYGVESDIAIAKFLMQLFKTSAEVSWARYWKQIRGEDYNPLLAHTSFMRGLVRRLNIRLAEMVNQRKAERAKNNSSRELLVLKDQLIDAKIAAEFGKLRKREITGGFDYADEHYVAGSKAGDHISISAGMVDEGPAKPKALETE
jgi:hypothetical protein